MLSVLSKIGFIISVLCIYSTGFCQQKFLVFEETFEDNRNDWLLGERAKTNAYIANGTIYLESKKARYNYSRRIEQGYLRSFQDFEIEIKIKQVKGDGHRGFALEWGGNSIDNTFYEFWLRKDGKYSIDRFNGITEQFTDYVPWKSSPFIKVNDFNILTVKKIGLKLHYFINQNEVFSMPFEKMYGNEVGFIAPPLGAVEVEYIKINILNEPPEPVLDKEYTPNIYAVIVGIADYQNDGPYLTDLRFTVSDALAMASFYNSENGGAVPTENIKLLINNHATYRNIVKTTADIFSKASAKDMVVFYYAGHGTTNPNATPELLHFLPYDHIPGNLNTAIVYTEIEALFEKCLASKKMWIIDACHSGGTLTQLSGSIKERLSGLVDKDIAVITSSDVNETSLEISGQMKRGLFSYYVTDGLVSNSLQSDSNNDGVVDVLELFSYAKKKTSLTAMKKYQHDQNPQIGGRFNVQLPLADVRP